MLKELKLTTGLEYTMDFVQRLHGISDGAKDESRDHRIKRLISKGEFFGVSNEQRYGTPESGSAMVRPLEEVFVGIDACQLNFGWIIEQISACANANFQHTSTSCAHQTLAQWAQPEFLHRPHHCVIDRCLHDRY